MSSSSNFSSEVRGMPLGIRFILKELIKYHNTTASNVCKAIKMPYPTFHQILNDDTGNPRIMTLRIIAKHFKVTIDQLIGDTPIPFLSDDYVPEDQPNSNVKDDDFHPWDSTLFIKSVECVGKIIKKQDKLGNLNQVLKIAKEVYIFSLSKKMKNPDTTFAEWYFNHTFGN